MGLLKRSAPLIAALSVMLLAVLSGCGSKPADVTPANAANNTAAENVNVSGENTAEANDAGNASSGMKILRIEGKVSVSDEKGSDIAAGEGALLPGGSTIETDGKSSAGVSLDESKSAVIGAGSRAKLDQAEKQFSIDLEEGEMYFSVPKPFAQGEGLEIKTPNVTMELKGAGGYAAVINENKAAVILVSGTAVLKSADGKTQELQAGQCVLISTADGKTTFSVRDVEPQDYPQLLLAELCRDEAMLSELVGKTTKKSGYMYDQAVKAVLAYREMIEHPESYDYALNGAKATGKYDYVFVKMQPVDVVPTLLLRQGAEVTERNLTISDRAEHIRIFQYNVNSGKVDAPEEVPGSDLKDIYLMDVYMSGDGNGLLMEVRLKDAPRKIYLHRVNIGDYSGTWLKTDLVAQGTDKVNNPSGSEAIQWRRVSEDVQPGAIEYVALPTDGNRTVGVGYLDTVSYEKAVELQGMPDWNGTDPRSTFRLILLDQDIYLDGTQADLQLKDRRVDIIRIGQTMYGKYSGYSDLPSDLDGHRIIFSVGNVSWSSGTDIPLGAPMASDIRVLEVLD